MSFESDSNLAGSITRAASKQTYYTIKFLVDRERIPDAYRAYAYFRWVDDILDSETCERSERIAFLIRQRSLMNRCYCGEQLRDVNVEEQMLVNLIQHDGEKNSGLEMYVRNLMAVMAFDTERRGSLISEKELSDYSQLLATAVTEALHYFIGHRCKAPKNEMRYLAVVAAHITHMLRDTFDDNQAGYFNIPREVLDAQGLTPFDVQKDAYRVWVKSRVELARSYFATSKSYLAQVQSLRCRTACLAYTARFEEVLNSMERDGYILRPAYEECKTPRAAVHMIWSSLTALLNMQPHAILLPEQQGHLRSIGQNNE